MLHDLLNAIEETLFMVFASGLFIVLIGLPLGILLTLSPYKKLLQGLIATVHKIPYMAMMILLIPLTRLITGSIEGSIAAIVPLTIGTIPYFTQLVAKAVGEVPHGLIDAAKISGASPLQMIYKVLLPEALPKIVHSLTLLLIQLISYSTIAGVLGAGGLGGLMIRHNTQTLQTEYVLIATATLMILSQSIQIVGNYISNGRA